MNNSILIVDDDPRVLSSLKRSLAEEPYYIHTAPNGNEGLSILRDKQVAVVISDEKMPGMTGSEFLSAINNLYPDVVRIMLTGDTSIDAAMKAVNNGEIYRFFTKPWDNLEIKFAIRSAIEKYDLEAQNRRLLRTVQNQASELSQIEKLYPGISQMEKDNQGNLILHETSHEEFKKVIDECEKEVEKK